MRKPCEILLPFAICVVLLSLGGCPQEGGIELPFVIQGDPTVKYQQGGIGIPTRVACYIDVEKYNPLNIGDYTLENSGTLYFDYAVLGSAELKKDPYGVYIYFPPALKNLLDNRFSYVTPLQRKGIKVLLGMKGGHDGITYGTLTEEERDELAVSMVWQVNHYGLDGVEIWDIDAAKSVAECPYPEGTHTAVDGSVFTKVNDPDQAKGEWQEGGNQMSNFILQLRGAFSLAMNEAAGGLDTASESYEDKIIIIRESNFANWMPMDPPMGVFVLLNQQFNYIVNPVFTMFGTDSTTMGIANDPSQSGYDPSRPPGHSILTEMYDDQYGPFPVNFDPEAGSAVVPPLEETVPSAGDDIFSFSIKFRDRASVTDTFGTQYSLIYYQNLRPVSAVAADNVLAVPASLAASYPGKSKLTQAEYMSITSQVIFGEDVVCSGGNR
jgi:hypothetical protein